MLAWLDHPLVNARYQARAAIEGRCWDEWLPTILGGPAGRSLHLGCGSAIRSIKLWRSGPVVRSKDWTSARSAWPRPRPCGPRSAAGRFWVEDVNTATLPAATYDLIFADHTCITSSPSRGSWSKSRRRYATRVLRPRGVRRPPSSSGRPPDGLVAGLLEMLPERLRRFSWGAVKQAEGRPTPAEVVAVSPFESIRSAEIVPIFERYFDVSTCASWAGPAAPAVNASSQLGR